MNYKKQQKSLTSQQWGIKMIRKIINYIKYSMEPNEQELRAEAMESAKKYFAKFQRYQVSVSDWQQYQHSYKSAYRHRYAVEKLKSI